MRTLTVNEIEEVGGGPGPLAAALIAAGAAIIAAVITSCADGGAKEPVTVVVNCGPLNSAPCQVVI